VPHRTVLEDITNIVAPEVRARPATSCLDVQALHGGLHAILKGAYDTGHKALMPGVTLRILVNGEGLEGGSARWQPSVAGVG
jgi:hypothetical protein